MASIQELLGKNKDAMVAGILGIGLMVAGEIAYYHNLWLGLVLTVGGAVVTGVLLAWGLGRLDSPGRSHN